jgi:hypothetical protein
MKKIFVRGLLVVAGVFVAIQLIQPDRTNPPVNPDNRIESLVPVSPRVASLLRNACFDCHSNETSWPWYSYVAPVSWLVSRDVSVGRGHINFSEWGSYDSRAQIGRLGAIAEKVESGRMPLPNYITMHAEADLSPEERGAIVAWAETAREQLIEQARMEKSLNAPRPERANMQRRELRIELLYFGSCPNHHAAEELIMQVLKEEGLQLTVERVAVETPEAAARNRFPGSPTIRVNGKDIDPTGDDGHYTLRCRVYLHEDGLRGVPDGEMIRTALRNTSS